MQNRNEHDLLKSLIDSMEGYPESVKFLHNNTQWNYTCAYSFGYYLCKGRIPGSRGKCAGTLPELLCGK